MIRQTGLRKVKFVYFQEIFIFSSSITISVNLCKVGLFYGQFPDRCVKNDCF